MSYIKKPGVTHPALQKNRLGLTLRDYEGTMSTLCAGCGHDSVTAALVRTFHELAIEPHQVAKLSGIGCSSKTPTYFLSGAHGFNSVHGRMPSIATGANAARRDMIFVGISGDGDSLSIGMGQLCHAIRRNINLLYVIENNGVYGLTKGQFSASADRGSKAKKGESNEQTPIDPMLLALTLGATFVARSFSGDKDQLVPILKAAIRHRGFALVDVISPCVTFNDHQGSTKSYMYTRDHTEVAVQANFVPPAEEIEAQIAPGETKAVRLHDGSEVLFEHVAEDFDPTDRNRAYQFLAQRRDEGKVVTGLLYCDPSQQDLHQLENTSDVPLAQLPYRKLCPGNAVLQKLQSRLR